MIDDLKKGRLKRWNDDKGFGFIQPTEGDRDIFVHISALKKAGHRPRVGDTLVYEVHTDNDGKRRAVNARIEGVGEATARSSSRRARKQNRSTWLPRVLSVVVLVAIGSTAYNEFAVRDAHNTHQEQSIPADASQADDQRRFSCSGKVYCSQMTSCDEARFYLSNCPGTMMDGDHDGIPCEDQWCRW